MMCDTLVDLSHKL